MCKETNKQDPKNCKHHFSGYCTKVGAIVHANGDIDFTEECCLCEHPYWDVDIRNLCYEKSDYCSNYELKDNLTDIDQ